MSIKEKFFGSKEDQPGTYTGADLQPDEQAGSVEQISQPADNGKAEPKPVKPVELVKQLISNKFIEVSLQMVATPTGLQNGMVFMMVNQSGRGMEKKSIPIAFEPVTGWPLADFTKEELGL